MKRIFYLSLTFTFSICYSMDDNELQRRCDEIQKNIAEVQVACQAVRDACQDVQKDCDTIINSYQKVDDIAKQLDKKYGGKKEKK